MTTKDSIARLANHGVEEIPRDWSQSRVKYLADYINGYPFKPDDWGTVGKPILRIQNLSEPGADANRFNGQLDTRYLIKRGDILISWSASVGVFRWKGEDSWLNQHIFKVKVDENRLKKDFFMWLAEWFVTEMVRDAHGSTMQHLTADAFGGFPVLLPPFSEQQPIADFLERETARLDALVGAKERWLELLAEKRRALITHAVISGLDTTIRFANTGVEWLPSVPRHWRPTKISRLFKQTKRLGFPELTVLSVYRDYGVIERSTRDDNHNRIPDDLEKYQLVRPGDLVINKMKAWQGSLGISELEGITSPDYVVFSPIHREQPQYLHFLLRNQLLTTVYLSMSNGIRTNQWRIEPDRFASLKLFMPPLDEQRAIVAYISAETAKLDALRATAERTIDLLKERRAALIASAITGKLNVNGV